MASNFQTSVRLLPLVFLAVLAIAGSADGASGQIPPERLESEIAGRLMRVPEFRYLRETAESLGVRVYLFGGTAAAYAHYVNWDLKRENGDSRYQPDRFDYDFTNIYRSNQDLDIVVDGPAEAISTLQRSLEAVYPHLQGDKNAWEVRSLRQDLGGSKMALLGNTDFLNQHTDSNSVGMIEITQTTEHVVKDLREWNKPTPHFLVDVSTGRLHFYFSDSHFETARAKSGMNPSILAAIRYLIKAVQFELEMDPESLSRVKSIIAGWDPSATTDPYVRNWIDKNASKLIQNAVNLEYASNLISTLGLKDKLIRASTTKEISSLAWWVSKEPLRSKEVGQGSGKTAAELGIAIVAHETADFKAYESITKAQTGAPNVLISRASAPGESAVHGDGFYTRVGREGARGTGWTIRFDVNPNAREGHDFKKYGDFVVFLNKNAIRVIQENMNLGVLDYVLFVRRGSLKTSDRGTAEKIKRRALNQALVVSPADQLKLYRMARFEAIMAILLRRKTIGPALDMWLRIPDSANSPGLMTLLLKRSQMRQSLLSIYLPLSHWANRREMIDRELERSSMDRELVARHVLEHSSWVDAKTIMTLIDAREGALHPSLVKMLANSRWKDHPELVIQLIDVVIDMNHISAAPAIARDILTQPHWAQHPELLKYFLKKYNGRWSYAGIQWALGTPLYDGHPEIIEELIKEGKHAEPLAKHVIGARPATTRLDWIIAMLDAKQEKNLPLEHLTRFPEIGDYFIRKDEYYKLSDLLKVPGWDKHPRLMQALFDNPAISNSTLIVALRADPRKKGFGIWAEHPEFFEQLYRRDREGAISAAHWGLAEKHHPAFVERVLRDPARDPKAIASAIQFLSREPMVDRPELLRLAMRVGKAEDVIELLVRQPKWGRHPEFFEAVSNRAGSGAKLAELMAHEEYAKEEWALRVLRNIGDHMGTALPKALMSPAWNAKLEARDRVLLAIARHPRHHSVLTYPFFVDSYDWSSGELVDALAKSVTGEAFGRFVNDIMEKLDFEKHPEWYAMLAKYPEFQKFDWTDHRRSFESWSDPMSRAVYRAKRATDHMEKVPSARSAPRSCKAVFAAGA